MSGAVAKRTRDSLHTDMGGGQVRATFGRNLHYEDAGSWKPVKLGWKAGGGTLVSDEAQVIVRATGQGLELTERGTGKGVLWKTRPGERLNPKHLTFKKDGLDWQYTLTKSGIKLAAMVSSRRGPVAYRWPFQSVGMGTLQIAADGSLYTDVLQLPPPIIVGADGKTYLVGTWQIDAGDLVMLVDDSNLPPAAFPYELDPTTTFAVTTGSNDGQVYINGLGYPPGGSPVVVTNAVQSQTGRSNTGSGQYMVANCLFRWDTSSIGTGNTISAANLKIVAVDQFSTDGRDVQFEWLDWSTINSGHWSLTPFGTAHAGYGIMAFTLNVVTSLPLLDPNSNINTSGYTGMRTHISGGTPGGYNYWFPAMFEHTTQPEPQLEVIYAPAFDPNQSSMFLVF